ncbi:MAG: AAA family ATPase [Gammaproteobacteria bacterium]|nr:AAA family ATPase [Gammaproteobacteria bacterium]MDA7960952.1 AAA family ATPase [Gammaproteobacteria bacterium]MDA7970235.1 AAA family ATPase [Gammaproteobacteria bacterium]MDA7971524.1 AAA family ATPase [Gammaproteobacteria bacterium]MDA7994956.1 AAA family ATPase [Gammaproteobacteria bacterium]
MTIPANAPARIVSLRVQNFRALRNVEFKDLQPMTVLLGPNGSGKSTVFDVFAFLSECFEFGLRRAWDKRRRAKELKTRNAKGPVVIEIQYREKPRDPLITYLLEVDEDRHGRPKVVKEILQWRRGSYGKPFRFLECEHGRGRAISGERPEKEDEREEISLKSSDLLAVNALGQFERHPRVAALRDFIVNWHVSYLSADDARGQPEAGPQAQLSKSGDNLANVIQFLKEQHGEQLSKIFDLLRQRVPRIEKAFANEMDGGRLLLQIKDIPFDEPVLARFASDGTLKMLAYLVLLHDPAPPPFIGVEEPENFLHPRLLVGLAEECRAACERTQLLITTHSPFFLDGLRTEEVRILWRDQNGHTKTALAAEIDGLKEFVEEGAQLGELWMEGHFGVGDPLTGQGESTGKQGK